MVTANAIRAKTVATAWKIAALLHLRKQIATMVKMMIATVIPIALTPNASVIPDVRGTAVTGFVIHMKTATVVPVIVRV